MKKNGMDRKRTAGRARTYITFVEIREIGNALRLCKELRPNLAALVDELSRKMFAPRRPSKRVARHLSPHCQAVTGPWCDYPP
jgi:hypothetical protein